MKRREHAELMRLQTMELINIQLKKEDRLEGPEKLWKFPWDGESQPDKPREVITEEQQAARLTNLLKSFKQ